MFGFKIFLILILLGKLILGNPILVEISDEGSGYGSGDAELNFLEGSGAGSGEISDVLGETKTFTLSADQKFLDFLENNNTENAFTITTDENIFVKIAENSEEGELSQTLETVTEKIDQYLNQSGVENHFAMKIKNETHEKAAKKSIFGENILNEETTEQEIDQLLNQNEVDDDSLNEIDVQEPNLNEIETSLNKYSEESEHTTINPFIIDHLTPFNNLSTNDTLPTEAFHTIYYEKDTSEDKIHDVTYYLSTKKSKSKDKAARKAGKKEAKKLKKTKKRNKKVQETTIDPFANVEEPTTASPENIELEIVDFKFDVDDVVDDEF